MQGFNMPPAGFGPGSQPSGPQGEDLEFLPMPSGMRTWSLHTPEVADPTAAPPALGPLLAPAPGVVNARSIMAELFDHGFFCGSFHFIAPVCGGFPPAQV